MRRKVVAGNWKMNKTNEEGMETIKALRALVGEYKNVDIVIGAPTIMLADLAKVALGSNVKIAAQNMYPKDSGAFTGEISPVMLKAIGIEYVILGHSERREYFHESDEFINEKVKSALAHGLTPILCIGEKLEERETGKTLEVNSKQIKGGMAGLSVEDAKKVIVAYEPVWAIGTGKTATPEMAQETHKAIRKVIQDMFGLEVSEKTVIQYGGSMNAANAAELMAQPDIDGGLVGGASLEAKVFEVIIKAGN
ncbi:MAG: triose-phosphate isomerase [Fusobacteriaceae bacterium]